MDPSQVEFIRLLAATQSRLSAYVLTLVPNLSDAEEIVQETHVRLWEQQERYEPGTDFAAWALRVGYYEVLNWRRRQQRDRLVFDDSLLHDLKEKIDGQGDAADARHGALVKCLSELSEQSLAMLRRIYRDGHKVRDIAEELGRSVESMYKVVQRLRGALRSCVEQRLAEERRT